MCPSKASLAGRATTRTPRAALALIALLLAGAPTAPSRAAESDAPLTLARAIEAAIAADPLAAGYAARREAALGRAESRGGLPPTELTLGIENVPTGSFALDAEDMTMVVVGLRQTLPAWGMRGAERTAAERMADAETAAAAERAAAIRRMVRERFAMAAAAEALAAAVAAELPRARAALDAAQGAYASNAVPQGEVAEARLWLAELLEEQLRARSEREVARAELGALIGTELAGAALADAEPGAVAPLAALRAALARHPLLALDAQRAAAAEAEAAAARAARRPEWMLDLRYGMRSGTDMTGMARDDMVSAMVGVSLPFGARNRGAERAAAAEARAMTAERDDRARELAATLESVAARHAALAEIEQLYAATTAPAAALNESAALREFGAARGGYAMLARSQRMRLEVERKRIAVTAERRLAAAQLMYLDGDQP
jgi:outer membrane protein TolC